MKALGERAIEGQGSGGAVARGREDTENGRIGPGVRACTAGFGPAVGLGFVGGLGGLGWGYVVPARVGVGRLGADAVSEGSEADGFEVAGEAVEGLAVLVGLEEDVGGA